MVGLLSVIDCLRFFSSHDNYSAQLFSVYLLYAWVWQELSDPSILGLENMSDSSYLSLGTTLDLISLNLTIIPSPKAFGRATMFDVRPRRDSDMVARTKHARFCQHFKTQAWV
jgi:hypothetical protein